MANALARMQPHHDRVSCFIIGAGSLLLQCANRLLSHEHRIYGLISADPDVQQWARDHELPAYHPDADVFAILSKQPFDYLFSINNGHVLPAQILSRPGKHAINYHDSPLPKYAGMYATSWAIIHREAQHGISWHIMTENVDGGDILRQRRVDIAPDDTAFSLNLKCYEAAIAAFADLITDIAERRVSPAAQDLAERSYFGRHQRPAAGGVIRWQQAGEDIDALSRGLTFGPYPNYLGLPKLVLGGDMWIVAELQLGGPTHPTVAAGTILEIAGDGLTVATTSRDVIVKTLRTIDGDPVSLTGLVESYGLRVGQRLLDLDREVADHLSITERDVSRHERFWVNVLANLRPLTVPYLQRRVSRHDRGTVAVVPLVVPPTSLEFLQERQWSLQRFIIATFAVCLARVNEVECFDLGFAPLALTRYLGNAKRWFASQIPWRVNIQADRSFEQVYEEVARQLTLHLDHRTYARDVVGRYPELQHVPSLGVSVTEVERVSDCLAVANDGLTLYVDGQAAEELLGDSDHHIGLLAYDPNLFERATIERLAGHVQTLLAGVVAAPRRPIRMLPLLAEGERHQVLLEWNETDTAYPRDACIQQLFEAQVERSPDAIALLVADQHVTYRRLNGRANQLAHHLRHLGVEPGACVGICVERSVDMVVGVLGILKAGAAYVPLDPALPSDRLRLIAEDTGTQVVLSQTHLLPRLPARLGSVLCLDAEWETGVSGRTENPALRMTAEFLAYVMYTSGSTGKPKGVSIPHRAVVRLVMDTNYVDLSAKDVLLQFAPLAFDASTFEVWGALLHGARLVMCAGQHASLIELGQALREQRVTVLWLTAALFHMFVDEQTEDLQRLRLLLSGGDVLSVPHVRKALNQIKQGRFVNGYGPTENTTFTCCHHVTDLGQGGESVPIGRPIANTQVYVLDRCLQPVPIGVPGELYVGGAGLAHGYLNRPALTAEQFIAHPFSARPGARLYRSGDRVRYLPDGNLEFLGRLDHQVKIRGFRVELGEIETILRAHPVVREAVVVTREEAPGQLRLVAYVVLRDQTSFSDLRAHLTRQLPDYMVPSAFVALPALPLTPHGKVDHQALPIPAAASGDLASVYRAPRSATEVHLAAVWADVLGVARVGLDDNFFALGGHSLLATRVVSRLRQDWSIEVPLRTLFDAPTLTAFSAAVRTLRQAAAPAGQPPLVPVDRGTRLPLSFAQERLWFLAHLDDGGSTYNIPLALRMRGVLEVAALEQAVREIVRRHESLRTTFEMASAGDAPVQVIGESRFELSIIDLTGLAPAAQDAEVKRLGAAEAQQSFDLTAGPLLRATLLRLGPSQTAPEPAAAPVRDVTPEHVLLLTLHHIVADGWSLRVFLQELSALYPAVREGKASPLPALPIQYADYAAWQRQWMRGDVLARQLAYWREQLAGAPPLLELPTARSRPAIQTFRGQHLHFALPLHLTEAVQRLARETGTTLFMTLLAAFQVLLHRYSGQDDVLVGTPIANRTRVEIEPLIGFFVNTLVLRTDLSGNPVFRAVLAQVHEMTLEAYRHQDVPFEKVVETLQPQRNLSHAPLYQVVFAMQNAPTTTLKLPGLALELLEPEHPIAKFDLMLSMQEDARSLLGTWEYNSDLFEPAAMHRMSGHFLGLLEGIVANPDQPIRALPLLTDVEHRQMLVEWNDTAASYPSDACLHDLFEAQVERTPGAVAVAFLDQQLTYRELNDRANQLAHYLLTQGVGPEVLVGICIERSIEMLVAVLGTLKAGGAYVPIDPAYPQARIAFMLDDAGVSLLLTSAGLTTTFPGATSTLRLDADWPLIAHHSRENPRRQVRPDDLAYCIYTSGSTGEPKGTLIEHRSLANYVTWAVHAYQVEAGSGAPVNTSISFDATITSLFTPLLVGKKVVMVPHDNEIESLCRLLQSEESFSLVKLTPTHLDLLSQLAPTRVNARYFIIGGEALFESHLSFWRVHAPHTRFINEYGPTETVVGCCTYDATEKVFAGAVAIGRPIANTHLYLLDQYRQPVPVGVSGELYIGGASVGRGYLNRPDLTVERFITNPFGAGRLYKTGDVVRRLLDGELEFLGRQDNQVKIRGVRIELGEIEATLSAHAQIRESVVELRQRSGAPVVPEAIRHCVRCGLPSHHPAAKLDADRVCNLCRSYGGYREKAQHYFKTMDDFDALVLEMQRTRTGEYDCLMLLSGGKDSTYVLAQLLGMGLRVLTFTLDNGYISEGAKTNIRQVVGKLEVDHVFGTLPAMNAVFVDSLKNFSNVCNGCFKVIYTLSMNLAWKHRIKYIVTGLSRGQIFETRLEPMFKNHVFDSDEIDRMVLEARKAYHRMNDVVSRCADVEIFKDDATFEDIRFIDFYRYCDTELAEMLAFLDQHLPWVRPEDTGRSTNCLINEVGIYIHKRDKGYHNYALPYSWDVILGHKTRDAALAELDDDIDDANVRRILADIGYDDRQSSQLAQQQLVAYYVAAQELNGGHLRDYLAARLPDYMVPTAFVRLPMLPMTPHGKVNRQALPAPEPPRPGLASTYHPPQSATEAHMATIWADVLGVSHVGRDDNFFALGGHSLLATQVVSRLRQAWGIEVPLRTLFQVPTVASLSGVVDTLRRTASRTTEIPLAPVDRRRPLPLSSAQERLWFLAHLEDGASPYNIPLTLRIRGALAVAALEESLRALVQRHESLRTTFAQGAGGGAPVQVIGEARVALPVTDLTGFAPAAQAAEVRRLAAAAAQQPFDLTAGPLVRGCVLRLQPGGEPAQDAEHIVLLTLHHMVADGWSLPVLMHEWAALYAARQQGQPAVLPPLPLQYGDYAVWQRARQQGELAASLAYWREQLAEAPPVLTLPIARPRPAVQGYRGQQWVFVVPPPLAARVRQVSQASGTTLFMTLLAAFQVLLHRYSGQDDVLVGTPIANRTRTELEPLIGLFVNTLVLRTRLHGNPRFQEVLAQVQAMTLAAYQHQEVPFEQVVDAVQPQRTLSHTPLVQVMFGLDNALRAPLVWPGGELELLEPEYPIAKFDLTLSMQHDEAGLRGTWEYNSDLFEAASIARLSAHFVQLLEGVVADPDQRIQTLPLLSATERQQLDAWSTSAVVYPDAAGLHALVEAQVERTPDAVAVVCGEHHLTYAELNRRANQVAHHLRALGIGPEVRVGICVERSLEMVVGLLGILKAGGAYVPLDPTYPVERLTYMLRASRASVLLTQQHLAALEPACPVHRVYLDADWEVISHYSTENPASNVQRSHLAYVIYTSGSTGQAKGVMIEHRSLVNLTRAAIAAYGISARDRVLQFASMSFDVMAEEIYPCLSCGGAVILRTEEMLHSVSAFAQQSNESRVTVWNLPTAYWHLVSHEQAAGHLVLPDALRLVIIGGERVLPERVERWNQGVGANPRLMNGYGPTEATVTATVSQLSDVSSAQLRGHEVPIGRPVGNVQVHVLDPYGQPVPLSVPGELYLGGGGVARGYLDSPALTAERFIPNPFSDRPGARLYKTGDFVRYQNDGQIEFIGRIDTQVKIRGLRIELGEIEAVLNQHPDVLQAVVLAREDRPGHKRLVAYVVTQHPHTSTEDLRRLLKTTLPEYMVPSVFVSLPALPITPSGKIDYQALPTPDSPQSSRGAGVAVPRTPAEQCLAAIWTELLGVEDVGIHDNFFALGGDSIISIQMVSRAHQAGLRITPKLLFQHQTIGELADVAGTVDTHAAEQGVVTGRLPLTPIQRWFFEAHVIDRNHFNQSMFLDVSSEVHPDWLAAAVQGLLRHHDALRLRFTQDGQGWNQENAGLDADIPLTVVDLSGLGPEARQQRLAAETATIQSSLNLTSGPLMRVALFVLGSGQPGRLLIVIHHLAVDGVSWRILLEDVESMYHQLRLGEMITLPPKTTSFRDWSRWLATHGPAAVRGETAYWQHVLDAPHFPLPVDTLRGVDENTVASAARVTSSLPHRETTALLRDVPEVYHTQINDVLLTALLTTVCQWSGSRTLLLDVEGHGREELTRGMGQMAGAPGGDVDQSRTVGWFTSIFPVRLELDRDHPGDVLKSVKEQLRQIPHHGMGYGLLRYLDEASELAGASTPAMSFNYLGQFDVSGPLRHTTGYPAIADRFILGFDPEARGPEQSPRQKRTHLLEVNCWVHDGELQVHWTYSQALHERDTIAALARGYIEVLQALLTHCASPDAGGYTPSDFPLARVDQKSLDQLLASTQSGGIEDIYELSPMQAGMLFDTLYAPESSVYTTQIHLTFDRTLDPVAWRQAWQRVLDRHPALRTAFHWDGLAKPLQVVRRQVPLPWETRDWRTVSSAHADLRAFLASDRRQLFDLSQAPLMRCVLIRLDEETSVFVWSSHHILMDGWSVPILFQEILTCYEAELRNDAVSLPRPHPYRDYIAWLQRQDIAPARAFWRRTLQGFTVVTRVPGGKSGALPETASADTDLVVVLSQSLRTDLETLARDQHLTLNTVVQGAWALLLRDYSGHDDMVFGATVAGRPPALSGVESIVGLFINTLPLRVQIHADASAASLLQAIQRQQAEQAEYAYTPLVDIQQCSAIAPGSALFESLVVFENYPFDPAVRTRWAACVREMAVDEDAPFALTLVVTLAETFSVCFKYDPRRFEATMIEGIADHFRTLLAALAANPHQPIAALDSRLDQHSQPRQADGGMRHSDEAEQFYF